MEILIIIAVIVLLIIIAVRSGSHPAKVKGFRAIFAERCPHCRTVISGSATHCPHCQQPTGFGQRRSHWDRLRAKKNSEDKK